MGYIVFFSGGRARQCRSLWRSFEKHVTPLARLQVGDIRFFSGDLGNISGW